MQLTDLTLEIRQGDLSRVGQIPWEEMDFELTNYHNNVGTWTLSLPSDHRLAATLRAPGAGMVLTGPGGAVLASGPTVQPEDASTPTDVDGTLTVSGITDDCVLADYIAFPNPVNPTVAGQTVAHDVRTGPAETLMHAYVNANCGPGAHVSRRKPGLIMGTNLARGPVVKKSARFPKLGNLCAELGSLASLGFRVIQRGSNLVFETYAVVDRSDTIRLDVRNGTLSGHKVARAAPGATHVLVAGQGEGVDRAFLLASTPASEAAATAWARRIERFVDQRQTDDETEYQQKADEILGEEGSTGTKIQVIPLDDETNGMRFGTDWNLGDQVTVVVGDIEFTSLVTGFKLKADETGFRLGALIGQAEEDAQRSFESRLSALERNAEALTRDDVSNAINAAVATAVADVTATLTADLTASLTVVPGVTLGLPKHIQKSSNTSRSSTTTLAADPHLQTGTLDAGRYEVEFVYSASGAAGDIRTDWSVPTDASGLKMILTTTPATAGYTSRAQAEARFSGHVFATTIGTFLDDTGAQWQKEWSIVDLPTGGEVALRWCQNASSTSPTTVTSDSYVRVTRVGNL